MVLSTPLRNRPGPERLFVRLAGAGAAAAAYAVCLPWDLRNRAETPGSLQETTPVSTVGAVALGAVLLLLAGYFGYRDRVAWSVLVTAVPPAALMFASFTTHTAKDASPWPLAWAFFTLLMGVGALVAARIGRSLRGDGGNDTARNV